MKVCTECGSRSAFDVCLPCRKGVKSIKSGNEGPFQVLCRRCGEPLTDLKSRKRGYGPTCWVIEQVGEERR